MSIPTHIVNLTARFDRKDYITKEFANRNEFDFKIEEAIAHETGAISLWLTLQKIVHQAKKSNDEYFIFCEDDHQFTEYYNFQLLQKCIVEAKSLDADLLCGGVSWFEDALQISDALFWMKKFSGLQFTVIYKKFYATILNATFGAHDAADYKISALSSKKFFIHPFISGQKEFGYSDVTPKNNGSNRVEELFAATEGNVRILRDIKSFYKKLQNRTLKDAALIDFETITISTYVINLPERVDRRTHIINQFSGKKEFDITIMDAVKLKIGAVGLWQSIQQCVQMGLDNDDDLIIICEDDHEFTEHYNRDSFIQNILEAHAQGCDVLSAGIGGFDHAVPITANRYWIGHFWSTQFIVVYRKFFRAILDEPYDDTVTADDKISEMTSHKMVLYPFMSIQHDFGYSDVTSLNNIKKGHVDILFQDTARRLAIYAATYKTYIEN